MYQYLDKVPELITSNIKETLIEPTWMVETKQLQIDKSLHIVIKGVPENSGKYLEQIDSDSKAISELFTSLNKNTNGNVIPIGRLGK